MKILGISCSPRKGGNTETLVRTALEAAQTADAEVEFFSISGKTIYPCDGCLACRTKAECHIKDDMQELTEKMWQADGIIFGSPVYFWNVTAQAKAVIDRTYSFVYSPQRPLRNKAAGAVVALGRNGSSEAIATLNSFFTGHRMVIVGNAIGFGGEKGTVKNDERGMSSAAGLGRAMVRYLKTGKM
ncbi:MAG TPA: flavodoxin family protein [Dehalococcoidales bacterium]